MADRIDALGDTPGRLAAFRGRVLEPGSDSVLDAIAREAAEELRSPTCLVNLVLERLLVIRGSAGLQGPQLPGSATDRDVTLCQYVVRDDALVEIPDTLTDPRVPGLSLRHGVRSYLGAPIRVGDAVVGSLCILDGAPRDFVESDRAVLSRHAERVTARLAELSSEQRGSDSAAALLRAATRPAFQDLRNAVWQLSMSLDEIRVAAFEAGRLEAFAGASVTLADGTPADLSQLTGALRAAGALRALTDSAQRAAERMQKSTLALEAATQRTGETADLAGAVLSATRLAEHFVKLVGGVSGVLPSALFVELPASAVIMQVSTSLAMLAQALLKARAAGGLLLSAQPGPERVTLQIRTQGAPALHQEIAAGLHELLGAAAGVLVGFAGDCLTLTWRSLRPA